MLFRCRDVQKLKMFDVQFSHKLRLVMVSSNINSPLIMKSLVLLAVVILRILVCYCIVHLIGFSDLGE